MTLMAHADDAELSCGGSLLRWQSEGAQLIMVELTAAQLGSRGTPSRRYAESLAARRLLAPLARICLGWEDGFFSENYDTLHSVIEVIRQFRPHILITNALSDRHPDHRRAAKLVERATFLAGLRRIPTIFPPHHTPYLFFAIQDRWMQPSFVVDISPFWEKKLELVRAYESQFFHRLGDPDPPTYLTRSSFFPHLEARAREMGHFIGAEYGEGFVVRSPLPFPPLPIWIKQTSSLF